VFKRLVEERLETCPECGHHFPMSASARIASLIDEGSWQEFDCDMSSSDPLSFIDSKPYPKRIAQYQAKTGLKDAVITGAGTINGHAAALGVMDFSFNGGSMGSVVGEKLTRMVEYATSNKAAAIIVSTSGGARMQEGVISLMQMAKTSAALARHGAAGLPFISIIANPTYGGVSASFAMLGDVIIAEPKAMVGFAGARVIANTIKQELPDGFQTAEFCQDHGQIDVIISRQDLRNELTRILSYISR
jgi:acetyl-CoA carboxylase carboxyl transferase subunit beta